MSYPNNNGKIDVIEEVKNQYVEEFLESINYSIDSQGNLDISLEELNKLIDEKLNNNITNHDFNLSGGIIGLSQYLLPFREVCVNLVLQELISSKKVVTINGKKVDNSIDYKLTNQDINSAANFIQLKGDYRVFNSREQDSIPVKVKEFFSNIWQVIIQTFSTNTIDSSADSLNRQNLYFNNKNRFNHKKSSAIDKEMQAVEDENKNIIGQTFNNNEKDDENRLSPKSNPISTVSSSNVKLLSKQEKSERGL